MDGLTILLLTKYAPDKLQEPTAITKAEALSSQALAVKSTSGAATGMLVVMDSRKYSEDVILKAVVEFNREHPACMAHSFVLPAAIGDIATGSWVFITQEED